MDAASEESIHKLLGIRDGLKIKLINEPDSYFEKLKRFPEQINFQRKLKEPVDVIHLFACSQKELSVELRFFKNLLDENGSFLVSWPVNNPKLHSDLDEKNVIQIGSENNLSSISSCKLDRNWSAVKFTRKKGNGTV